MYIKFSTPYSTRPPTLLNDVSTRSKKLFYTNDSPRHYYEISTKTRIRLIAEQLSKPPVIAGVLHKVYNNASIYRCLSTWTQ